MAHLRLLCDGSLLGHDRDPLVLPHYLQHRRLGCRIIEQVRDAAHLLCTLPPMRRIVQSPRGHLRSTHVTKRCSSIDEGNPVADGLDVALPGVVFLAAPLRSLSQLPVLLSDRQHCLPRVRIGELLGDLKGFCAQCAPPRWTVDL
jgi:hypothetical protein